MRYCESCGARLEDGARFCLSCGAMIETGGPTSTAASSPTPTPIAVAPARSSKHHVGLIAGVVAAVVLSALIGAGAALVVNHVNGPVEATSSRAGSKKDSVRSSGTASDTSGSGSSKSDVKTASRTYTASQARDMARRGDFTPVAGKYCTKDDDTCLFIDAKGKVTQTAGDGANGLHIGPGGSDWTQLQAKNQWEPESGAAVELVGRDTDWHCAQGLSDQNACYDAGAVEADFDLRPIDLFWVPADTPYESLNGIAGASVEQQSYGTPVDTSKTFLYWAGYHMNDMPTDEGALYKTEK